MLLEFEPVSSTCGAPHVVPLRASTAMLALLTSRFVGIAPVIAIASEALVRIAALYAIEDEIRGLSADDRRAVRQARTKPLVDALEFWLREQLARLSKGSTLAREIRYGLNHW